MFHSLTPSMPNAASHWLNCWEKNETVRYYVEQRSAICNAHQRLDLYFPAPYCEDCIQSLYWYSPRLPDISPRNWQEDLAWAVGSDTLKAIRKERRRDPDFSIFCKRCRKELRPWESDNVYTERLELPQLYSIPLCQPGQVNPSKRLKQDIKNIYGNRCFSCKASETPLHIDHIMPRSKGGTSVFSNLQPLCERCGQLKGETEAEDITLVNDMFFGPYPADSYEGLFW